MFLILFVFNQLILVFRLINVFLEFFNVKGKFMIEWIPAEMVGRVNELAIFPLYKSLVP